eukprot:4213661-Amphidinium_carterae.1
MESASSFGEGRVFALDNMLLEHLPVCRSSGICALATKTVVCNTSSVKELMSFCVAQSERHFSLRD